MELTTLIIGWVLVTTTVVVLAYMRMTMGLHDILAVRFTGQGPAVDPKESQRTSRMTKIDRVGIPLTIVSAAMALAILVVWAMQQAGPA
ncbi:MAG: hypothetical protein GC160_02130 [Acidobacteria bacterium]|nr:hypothetical protein [Acidobacteriota bacterium]